MSIADRHIAIVTHDYFEQSELEVPLQTLQSIGVGVSVISATGKTDLQAMNHAEKATVFTADLLIQDADPDTFDALIIPGGVINADALRMDQTARNWVIEFLQTNKLVAAICHAPWLLVSARCIADKTVTSYYTLQDDIRNAGGVWVDTPVSRDGNIITSRQPDDVEDFVNAIKAWLEEYDERSRSDGTI